MNFLKITVLVALGFGTLALNGYILNEAFGSGAPYYSRTTNMDKWQNPIPYLLIVDFIVIIFAFFCFKYMNKKKH